MYVFLSFSFFVVAISSIIFFSNNNSHDLHMKNEKSYNFRSC